jgi:hypothetical protein
MSPYMTFAAYQSFARNLQERAERLAQSIRNRAIAISAARLGPTDGTCFLMAHNWRGQSWMTPDQNDAARLILYLERQSWEPSRIAGRVIARAWRRVRTMRAGAGQTVQSEGTNMTDYEKWLDDVKGALRSVNMPFDDWQSRWHFDLRREFESGAKADDAAMKANRFWWREQNKSLKQDCRKTPDCWLPRGHQGACQPVSVPTYEPGDFVKSSLLARAEYPASGCGSASITATMTNSSCLASSTTSH